MSTRTVRWAVVGVILVCAAAIGWMLVVRWAVQRWKRAPGQGQIVVSPDAHEPVPLETFADAASLRWKTVPRGTQTIDGVIFVCNGAVRLAGLRAARDKSIHYPGAILGIPVNRQGSRIHLLQAAENHSGMPEGAAYGRIVLHYQGGEQRQIDLLFGVHGRDWFHGSRSPDDPVSDPNTNLGFSIERSDGMIIRGFHSRFTNPLPRQTVLAVDLISPLNMANLLLFGLTIDDDARLLAPLAEGVVSDPAANRAQVVFILGKADVAANASPTLQWTAIGSNFSIDFPPFPVDALDRVLIEIPRGPVEQIRYTASSGNGRQAEGVLEKDENGAFPKEFRVKW